MPQDNDKDITPSTFNPLISLYSSPTPPRPTILIIPGSWHVPAHYARIIDKFVSNAYEYSCPLLPSNSPSAALFGDDAKCIQDELTRLIVNEGKEVVVLAHSSGGILATEAVLESFSTVARSGEKKSGGVLGIVYVGSFMMSRGPSISELSGGLDPRIIYDKDTLMGFMSNGPYRFYNDLPAREAQYWAQQSVKQNVLILCAKVTHEAWRYHPVGAIFTLNDNAVPIDFQRKFVDVVKDTTIGPGSKVHVVERSIETSHSPFLSRPDLLFETVEDIMKEFSERK